MCLLCEELWMPFELPPQSKARTFVADAPEPDDADPKQDPPAGPPTEQKSGDGERS